MVSHKSGIVHGRPRQYHLLIPGGRHYVFRRRRGGHLRAGRTQVDVHSLVSNLPTPDEHVDRIGEMVHHEVVSSRLGKGAGKTFTTAARVEVSDMPGDGIGEAAPHVDDHPRAPVPGAVRSKGFACSQIKGVDDFLRGEVYRHYEIQFDICPVVTSPPDVEQLVLAIQLQGGYHKPRREIHALERGGNVDGVYELLLLQVKNAHSYSFAVPRIRQIGSVPVRIHCDLIEIHGLVVHLPIQLKQVDALQSRPGKEVQLAEFAAVVQKPHNTTLVIGTHAQNAQ